MKVMLVRVPKIIRPIFRQILKIRKDEKDKDGAGR